MSRKAGGEDMAKKHLIIGCGPAALSALEEIRSISAEDEIKLVTMEEHPPYSPSVLPYLLAGRTKEAEVWLRDESYSQRMTATFAKGKEVVRVLPERKEVVYRDGDRDRYDTILIATGSKPVKPPAKGLDEAGFLGFHIMDHYRKLLQQLENKRNVAIYGAGLVAIEVAMALLERGYSVKVIVRSRVLRRYFDKDVGTVIEDIFRGQGAQIYTGSEISEVKRSKGGIELILASGSSLDADVLITATGVEPRTHFLEGSGVKVNRGVLVDSRMRTNIPDIYAAGDVAEAPGFSGEPGINPILPNALSQGKVAGANMAGGETDYQGWIAMNILKFFGNSALSVGLSMPPKDGYQVLEEKKEERKQFRKFVYEGDQLVGAMILNVDVDPGAIRYLIEKRVDIGPNKQALLEKPDEISRWLVLENERKGSRTT